MAGSDVYVYAILSNKNHKISPNSEKPFWHDWFPFDAFNALNLCTEIFRETKGMCLVWCSSQNIDRLISVWDAAKQSNRQLILDMYTAEIIKAADDDLLPKPGKDGVTVFLPYRQPEQIKRKKAFDIPKTYYPHRIYPEALPEAAARFRVLQSGSALGSRHGA